MQPAPRSFDYHRYLETILDVHRSPLPFYIATAEDFAKGSALTYPYRSYFYAVGLLHKGQRRLRIGTGEYELTAQALTLVGPGIVRQWLDANWDATTHTIFFTADFFEAPLYGHSVTGYPFFQPVARHVLYLSNERYAQANDFIRLLTAHANSRNVTKALLLAFLAFISEVYAEAERSVRLPTRNAIITSRFQLLLHQHYQEQKDVLFYADQLHTTSKRLSAIIKQETGQTAKQMIDDFVLFEAKSLLKQTGMSIKEIVYWLGYKDPSYFVRLFKSKTGLTPFAYRRE